MSVVTFIDGPFELQKRSIPNDICKSGYYRVATSPHIDPFHPMETETYSPSQMVPILTYVIERVARRNKYVERTHYIAYLELTP